MSAGEATINIYVTAVNDPPVAQPLNLTSNSAYDPFLIQLNSTDVDTNFAEHPFYTIRTWPRVGTLYQAILHPNNTVTIGDLLVQRDRLPNLEALPAAVLNASSQYTKCPAASQCYYLTTCHNCTLIDFHAVAVLKIDVFPKTADAAGAWEAFNPPAPIEYAIPTLTPFLELTNSPPLPPQIH